MFKSLVICLLLCHFGGVITRKTVIYIVYPATATTTIVASGLKKDTTDLAACALVTGVKTTVTIPVLFPLVRTGPSVDFVSTFLIVLDGIFPLLVYPFLTT